MNGQRLLDEGTHKVCGCRKVLIPASWSVCAECVRLAVACPKPAVVPDKPRPRGRGPRTAPACVRRSRLGGFAELPDQKLVLVVPGKPITQGSLRALAAGVIKRESGPQLEAWRTAIHRQALAAIRARAVRAVDELGWVPADCPIRLHAVFTLPMPANSTAAAHTELLDGPGGARARIAPSAKPDVDKLLRAVGDALSPQKRLRLFQDDSRIVEMLSAKTFPAPEHAHPWALPVPGVVVMACPADVPAVFPPLDLADPGTFPADFVDALPRDMTFPS